MPRQEFLSGKNQQVVPNSSLGLGVVKEHATPATLAAAPCLHCYPFFPGDVMAH